MAVFFGRTRAALALGTVAVAMAVLVTPHSARATVAVRLSLQELVDQSVLVAHARVERREVVPQRGPRGEIYTRTTLRVLRYLQGSAGPTLTVQQLGGTLGGLTMHVEGNATMTPGDEVVVFLDHDPTTGLSYVVGMAQGCFRVVRRGGVARVSRDLSGIGFYYGADTARSGRAPRIVSGTLELAPTLDRLFAQIGRAVRRPAPAATPATGTAVRP